MLRIEWISETTLTEVVLLLLAFVLSAIVGLERHRQVKSAGLRTHTLVGLGAALFTLISSYGFHAVIAPEVIVDPSRIAAQIVSGVGFLGAGVIFVRRNVVSGLTTAASVWVVAAIGMACGAGMPVLAVTGTALHLVAAVVLALIARRVPTAGASRDMVIAYLDGKGALRSILQRATDSGFEVTLSSTRRTDDAVHGAVIEVRLRFNRGARPVSELVQDLAELDDVRSVAVA